MTSTTVSPLQDLACSQAIVEYHDPVESSRAPFRPGNLLDNRFLITEVLSSSGMGTVFKAEDRRNRNAPVAVKVPHLACESNPGFFSRFQREERIGLELNHPYILRFIPVPEQKSRPYIVTEYLSGCTLAHLLKAMRPLPEKDALKIASLLCDALQHMHDHGIVHRDLKPQNVMICRDRTIRIMDFGIARDDSSRRITRAGNTPTMGTPDYMAPEQVRGVRTDKRTDIYNLGALLYEMLTGTVPFPNENPWAALNAQGNRQPGGPAQDQPRGLATGRGDRVARCPKEPRRQVPVSRGDESRIGQRRARSRYRPRQPFAGTGRMEAPAARKAARLGRRFAKPVIDWGYNHAHPTH